MRQAILELEQLTDNALFETLSEGMPLIVDNAVSHEEAAHHLYRDGKFQASKIMRGFAKEEAAKFLILIDYVRCPRRAERRMQVLKCFYGHVAKRIHGMACEYPSIASFGELSELVESESRPWYLDGPNGVDWIFPNSIMEKRDHVLYVDYVRDITDAAGVCYWTAPDTSLPILSRYAAPDCVRLVLALFEAGVASAQGLTEIADIWRDFKPTPDTDRGQLRRLIVETLERLELRCGAVEEAAAKFILSHWPFPLWPLTIKEPRQTDGGLECLREEREKTVEWIERIEAKRDPAPAISRLRVEAMSIAYAAWEKDVDLHAVRSVGNEDSGLRIRSSSEAVRDFELASYKHVRGMLSALSDEERAALALGWYAKDRLRDWPRVYGRAVDLTPSYNEVYQISLGSYWLTGLDRWAAKPRPFKAGRW